MTRQRLKDLASLSRSKGRRQHGLFLVEGVRSVEAALDAGAALDEVIVSHENASELVDRAHEAGISVSQIAPRDLDRIGDAKTSQGVVAVARSIVTTPADAMRGAVILLDGVQDPGNVGTIIRTAAWFGVRHIVADTSSADFESPKVVRASMGGLWNLGLARVPDLDPVLDRLAEADVPLWGADLGGVAVGEWAPGAGDALVLGSEAHGLSQRVRQRLSGRVSIPAAEVKGRGVESLNVSVAAGILLARWLG